MLHAADALPIGMDTLNGPSGPPLHLLCVHMYECVYVCIRGA